MELLYGSGLRATELVSLPRHAVRPTQPYLVLTGKGGKERLAPLSARAQAAVERHVAHVPPDSRYLFPSGTKHLSRMRLFQLVRARPEEHTSELQSLMRSSYPVFRLHKQTHTQATPIAFS